MRKMLSVLMALSFVFLCACASGNNGKQVTEGPTTQGSTIMTNISLETTAPVETTLPALLSDEEIYNAFLSELCLKLRNIIVDDTHLDGFDSKEGMLGISEITTTGDVDLLKRMGYSIVDINQDGISELLICKVDELTQDPCKGTRILCAYTVLDNQKALILEGNSKNRYYLLEDGSVYNESSDGTTRYGFGTFALESTTNNLSCLDLYFAEASAEHGTSYYHNQSGQFDSAVSDKFEGDGHAFETVQADYASRIKTIELTALEAFEG